MYTSQKKTVNLKFNYDVQDGDTVKRK